MSKSTKQKLLVYLIMSNKIYRIGKDKSRLAIYVLLYKNIYIFLP